MATNIPKVSKPVFKPYEVDVNDEQKEEIELWISDRIENALTGLTDRDAKIAEYRKIYAGDAYDREPAFEGGANVRIPIVPIFVEAILVRLVQSHFGVNPYIRVNPSDDLSNSDTARSVEEVLNHLLELGNIVEEAYKVITDACIAGTGVSKTTWFQDWKMVSEGGSKKYVLRNAYPKVEYIPLEDFITFPVKCKDIDSAMLVGHRLWKRWDDIIRGVGLGLYNEDWVEEIKEKVQASNIETDQDTRLGISNRSVDWTDQEYEIFELIVGYDLDEDGLEEDYLVTYDRVNKKLLRFITYPAGFGERWYETYTPIPLSGTIYGDSIVRQVAPMDEEITTIYNQRIDNNTIVNMPQYKVLSSSRAARDNEQSKPGKKWIVDDMSDIGVFETIPPMRDTSQEEQQLVHYAEMKTGMSELRTGQTSSGEKTAYEIEATLAEGSIKLRLFIKFGTHWLTRVAWHSLGLMKDFMSGEDFERIATFPFILEDMSWEEVWKELDIIPLGNTTTSNRELERQTIVFLREALKNDPLLFTLDPTTGQLTPNEGWFEINKDFILAHGKDDYKRFIGEPPQQSPREPIIQSPTEAEAQLAAQGSGGAQMPGAANQPSAPEAQIATGSMTPSGTA